MKYKLKLNYTENELRELKELGKAYDSPIHAIGKLLMPETHGVGSLQAKYMTMEHTKEFNFMADVNNVVMGTAIFPEKKYVIHDKVTDQYIYYNVLQGDLHWWQLGAGTAEKKTKEEWLAINPAYEPMLEEADDDEW